ncbi:MAG: hypothetical protein U0836_06355 [Pirellulales bacterium]
MRRLWACLLPIVWAASAAAQEVETTPVGFGHRARARAAADCPDDGQVMVGDEEGLGAAGLDGQPWAPPGIRRPWPRDEYLHDGGDHDPRVYVRDNEQIDGLDLEDTIIHGDASDGTKVVTPSNRVHLYAPRFAAVRQVVGLAENEQQDALRAVDRPLAPVRQIDRQLAATSIQREQAEGQIGRKRVTIYRGRQFDGGLSSAVALMRADEDFAPHENLQLIKFGKFSQREKAAVIEGVQAAIVWTHDKAVQVILNHQAANELVGDRRAQAIHIVDTFGQPSLRIVKVASTDHAQPGDEVSFTLRYDNVGELSIGNVSIVDNLTTRLEYVEGSAESNRQAAFSFDPNQGDSLALRWDLAEPLAPGAGGVLRFKCRVR